MAVEYHLITPFGLGQTAAMTIASPCVVTIPAGTVLRDGNPVVFTTTGALPTGVTSGTTYYSRRVTDTTYHLYDTEANAKNTGSTTGRVNTSGSQSGTHTITGGYWYNLPTTDSGGGGNYKNRYYYGGAYQVARSYFSWHTLRHNRKSFLTDLVGEFEGKFVDTEYTYYAYSKLEGFHSITCTTKIKGSWGSGFHSGVPNSAYKILTSYGDIIINNSSGCLDIIEGMDVETTAVGTAIPIFLGIAGSIARQNILKSACNASNYGTIFMYPGTRVSNNLILGSGTNGIITSNYSSLFEIFNNTVTGCATGIAAAVSSTQCFVIGNICYGNTTNWSSAPTNGYFTKNAGQSDGGGGFIGGTPWTSPEGTNVAILSGDFADYSGANYRPSGDSSAHTSSSLLVDTFAADFSVQEANDLAGNPRPSYKNGSSTNWDIGAYEFDWGYGLAPEVLTISNLTTGTRVIATRADTGASLGTATETSGTATISIAYSGLVNVEARNASGATTYKPWTTQISFPATKNVIALQEVD